MPFLWLQEGILLELCFPKQRKSRECPAAPGVALAELGLCVQVPVCPAEPPPLGSQGSPTQLVPLKQSFGSGWAQKYKPRNVLGVGILAQHPWLPNIPGKVGISGGFLPCSKYTNAPAPRLPSWPELVSGGIFTPIQTKAAQCTREML